MAMWKVKEILVIVVLLAPLFNCITNKNEAANIQIEAPQENRRSDKFVLIGHSDVEAAPGTINVEATPIDRNMRTRKFFQTKEDFYTKKYIDENSKEVEAETDDGPGNITFLNPRSGYAYGPAAYGSGYGGRPTGLFGPNYSGNGYSFGHGYSSNGLGILGSGIAGLGSLHLLDPLLLLATLSFVLFLVNSVITLVERLRIGSLPVVTARREFLAREDPENHPHIHQQLFNEMEQFFHQMIHDYEAKLQNENAKN